MPPLEEGQDTNYFYGLRDGMIGAAKRYEAAQVKAELQKSKKSNGEKEVEEIGIVQAQFYHCAPRYRKR